MVKPSHARIASAESALRLPVGGGLGTGWVVWEGINKLWEHILLSWICDRLRDREGLVDFLKWTVAHPFWFLFALVVGYLAIVALKAMFGGTPESDSYKSPPDASASGKHQYAHSETGPATSIGSIEGIHNSNINFGGTQTIQHAVQPISDPIVHLEPEIGHVKAHDQCGKFILMLVNTGLEDVSMIDVFITWFLALKSLDGKIVLKAVGPVYTVPNYRIARLIKKEPTPFEVVVTPLLPILQEAAQANHPDRGLFGLKVIVKFRRAADGKTYEFVRGYGMDLQGFELYVPLHNYLGPFDFSEVLPYLMEPSHWSNVARIISSTGSRYK
jgi:hypothetical protein